MAHPYRTPPRREPARPPAGRLLTTSVAFGAVCVFAGCVVARSDARVAMASAVLGGVLIARRPTVPR